MNGFFGTFVWHYVRLSPLMSPQNLFLTFGVLLVIVVTNRAPLYLAPLVWLMIIAGVLLLNYLAWRTIGRLLTTRDERLSLTTQERAELAWKFWSRPARNAKT